MSPYETTGFRSGALAIKQFRAPHPPLRHEGPDGSILWIMRELGHKFAFGGELQEFLGGIHRLFSLRC